MVALALAGYVAPEQRVRPEPLAPAEDTVVTSTGEEIVRARALTPTAKQAAILQFIRDFITREGMPPTLREIGANFGIRSTNGVNDHLRALERKGLLRRHDMKSRALLPLGDGGGHSPEVADVVSAWRGENVALRRLLGRVLAAGTRGGLQMSAEMIVVLGDVRDVLASKEVG